MRTRNRVVACLALSVLWTSTDGFAAEPGAGVPQLEPFQTLDMPTLCNPLCVSSDSALDRGTAMVPGPDNTVAVYERRADGQWTLRQTLHNPAAVEGNTQGFARNIALSGNWAIFISDIYDDGLDRSGHHVQVFHRSRGSWRYTQELILPFENAPGDQSSVGSVALDGEYGLISTQIYSQTANSGGGATEKRHVYALHRGRNGRFRIESEVLPNEPAGEVVTYFGYRLTLQGNIALISGAPEGNSEGAVSEVRSFERTGRHWRQRQILRASDAGGGTFFGIAVAMAGDRAAISAPYVSRKIWYQGSVYIFRRHRGVWELEQQLFNPEEDDVPNPSDWIRFGQSLDLSRNNLVVQNSGSPYLSPARLYQRNRRIGEWTEVARLSQPGLDVGDVNVQGSTALIFEWSGLQAGKAAFYRLPRLFDGEEADSQDVDNQDDADETEASDLDDQEREQ